MASFDLDSFLLNPSLDQINKCRKDNLVEIAVHFNVLFAKSILKKELKSLVIGKLVELGVIVLPVLPESPVCAPGSETAADYTAQREFSKVSAQPKTPFTLPRYDPPFSGSTDSLGEARLKVRLARIQMEAQERAENRQAKLRLEIRKMEIEADKAVRLRQLELEAQLKATPALDASADAIMSPPSTSSTRESFDIGKHISLVPPFRDSEVDSYFPAFERIATALQWPYEEWPLLLQCKIHGKAQEAVAALPLAESLNYEKVKMSISRAYELVPEAYRQKFRNHTRGPEQTYVEFAREKGTLFDKWCNASKAADFSSLRELILLEEFKKCLPERIVVYLNEQKVSSLSAASVLADEFVLTHKPVFLSTYEKPRAPAPQSGQARVFHRRDEKSCNYCHKSGHLIANCPSLNRKKQNGNGSPPKGVGLIKSEKRVESNAVSSVCPDPCFEPFIFDGYVSLTGETADQCPVRILRDTGGSQSVILASALPFSEKSFCGYTVALQGIEMGYVPQPVHTVHIKSWLISGVFPVAVIPALPIKGVVLLMCNDIAGGQVTPALEVSDSPQSPDIENETETAQKLFPSCAVTRAQSRKLDEFSLSDTVLMSAFSDVEVVKEKAPTSLLSESAEPVGSANLSLAPSDSPTLPVGSERLAAAQRADPTLARCFKSVVSADKASGETVSYLMNKDILVRKWTPAVSDCEYSALQVVVPFVYRQHVLSVAHESKWSGHLGVNKTYNLILKHFFWPGLKSDVAKFCRSCHVCQLAGKPNQTIPPAPLHPIPTIGEPFERVILDCVGPLPRSKTGNQYLLTIMCAATRYPEAVPLRKITSSSVVKALTKFFSTFGLPRVIQTDQGTNFQSRLFKQVLKTLNVQHSVSSAYHPESQGALERWHQTLKSMLRKYSLETGKSWDEGVPFVLFAARDAVQASLGFSPAELVFGHTLRGPLKSLQEKFLSSEVSREENVLDFMSKFRERLHRANSLAKECLLSSQTVMKRRYDRSAVPRRFDVGDKVLALLPIPGSSLSAKFTGPYEVRECLSDLNYVIATPERRRKSRVCHINMLKPYFTREPNPAVAPPVVPPKANTIAVNALIVTESPTIADEDDLQTCTSSHQTARLPNSESLKTLSSQLSHLTRAQQSDLIALIDNFKCLFGDVPTRTTVLQHDIDVNGAKPIRQHPYRLNPVKRQLMKKETDYLLKHGLAVPSSSAWSSPCLLEKKSDGTPRFITDLRKVNSVTVKDSYPLPRMEDCVDTLGSAKYVSKLDLLKGYWQVPLTERASEISAFVTPDCFLQYTVMAFGMCNAPATFQRLVNTVLAGLPNCNAYLDDLIVYTVTWQEHLRILEQVFTRLAHATLTLNLAKCDFGKATVTYLGRQVGQGQVKPLDAKVTAIAEFPVPTTRKALRRFLGIAGYYRSFCRNFSSVVQPLTSLTNPKVEFDWSPACQHAFDSAKSLLSHAPVLAAPDFSQPFKLEVDASAVGVGAVLLQEDSDGVDHPVGYFSRKFNKHQVNYSIIEKETLALLWSLQHFEVYVGSSPLPVVVFTDHNPLVFLHRMYNHNQRLMRWALVMQDYNVEIQHKKGSDNVVADALSRM
ncbi:uncharacterized protein LOC118469438 [Xyrichtys novacula]|uniref:Gypsy retrotransposon integrase-like protein 1 n=1 Tax=Xyrichtys novacula TaxID=13765 RepID=A0AAV1HSM1_XYRNO|nr:uncharacterized protein LOC118469438 [Xyrichtys novacula]